MRDVVPRSVGLQRFDYGGLPAAVAATFVRIAKGNTMSDKSPRQSMSKKSAKSIKEKRAEKKVKSTGNVDSAVNLGQHKRERPG